MSVTFTSAITNKKTLFRGALASIFVGSLLTLINQGPDISMGDMPALWQVVLTYIVPFCVSTSSSALADVQNSRLLRLRLGQLEDREY